MKHSAKESIELLLWAFLSIVCAFFIYPLVRKDADLIAASPISVAVVAIIAVLAGAIFWWFAMSKLTRATVEKSFATILALSIFMTLIPKGGLVPYLSGGYLIGGVALGIISMFALAAAIYYFAQYMKKSWANTQKWYWVWNVLFCFSLVAIGAKFASVISPIAALAVLGVVAIYDAWAVWKSKTMIKMANYFLESRMCPGIIKPKPKKDKWALLGGGDVFFIVAVSLSFVKTNVNFAFTTAIAMFIAVIYLFIASEKGKMYPAIPYIFAGALVGVLAGWTFL